MLKVTHLTAPSFLENFREPAVLDGIDDAGEDSENYNFIIFRPDIVHYGKHSSIDRKVMFASWNAIHGNPPGDYDIQFHPEMLLFAARPNPLAGSKQREVSSFPTKSYTLSFKETEACWGSRTSKKVRNARTIHQDEETKAEVHQTKKTKLNKV